MSFATIEDARATLPAEFGHRVVEENGRRVLLVRVPGAKPDYLHVLRDVALYVDLDDVKDTKDVLLVGSEKVTRLEPLMLRDHIRTQREIDANVAKGLRPRLMREYAHAIAEADGLHSHPALAVRIPRGSLAEITPDDVKALREKLRPVLKERVRDIDCVYILSDTDFERLGRRVFLELVDPEGAAAAAAQPPPTDDPKEALMQAAREAHGPPATAMPPAAHPSTPSLVTPTPPARSRGFEPHGPKSPVLRDSPPVSAGFIAQVQEQEYEVYVRKPPPEPAPSFIVPPAAAPLAASRPSTPPSVASDEYEIVTRKPATIAQATPTGPIGDNGGAVNMTLTREAPLVEHAQVAPATPLQASTGTPSLTPVAAADVDFDVLASRLTGLGYQVVRNVKVAETAFEIAAHKPGGRRLLAKSYPSFAPEDAPVLDKLAVGLGADCFLVVARDVAPGSRLATWGTRVEVFRGNEVVDLGL